MNEPIDNAGCFETEMETYTGRMFDLLNPDPKAICIEDIATALAGEPRYASHSWYRISVAEHSVHVYRAVRRQGHPPLTVFLALMHDAHEAYTKDIHRPMRLAMKKLGSDAFERIAWDVQLAIEARFGITATPEMRAIVKEADNAVGRAESEQVMASRAEKWSWGDVVAEQGLAIHSWDQSRAKLEFLSLFSAAYFELWDSRRPSMQLRFDERNLAP